MTQIFCLMYRGDYSERRRKSYFSPWKSNPRVRLKVMYTHACILYAFLIDVQMHSKKRISLNCRILFRGESEIDLYRIMVIEVQCFILV